MSSRRIVALLLALGGTGGAGPRAASQEGREPVPPPRDLVEALQGGTVRFDLRLRAEWARQEGLERAAAYTERVRLGYETQELHGFRGFLEFENVEALNESLYNAAGLGGDPDRTVVADPEVTEVNQAWVSWHGPQAWPRVTLGRQRITFDDHRFVGNVGWRQNEQTFDAALAAVDLGEAATFTWVWLLEVHTVLGTDRESDSHAFHLDLSLPEGWGSVSLFSYLLRFPDERALGSDTFGLRWEESFALRDDLALAASAAFAWQEDGRSSPLDYGTHYARLQGVLRRPGLGGLGLAFEELGSDGGEVGFSTPLATLHAFNGWADAFLQTPAAGLEDWMALLEADLPWAVKGSLVAHRFREEHGDGRLGSELDALLSRNLGEHVTVLLKAAWFDGSRGFADRVRYWFETTVRF